MINGDSVKWLKKRSTTFGLSLLFVFWYAFQMIVLALYGPGTATWFFYTDLPPSVDPGLLFSPISHNIFDLTHLITNVGFLLFVGSLLEPYVHRWKIPSLVIVGGYIGMAITMVTAIIHKFWPLLGASTGIMILWGYTGFRMWHELNLQDEFLGETLEEQAASFVVLSVPVIPLYEVFINGNMSHAIGIVLGVLYFGVEQWTETIR